MNQEISYLILFFICFLFYYQIKEKENKFKKKRKIRFDFLIEVLEDETIRKPSNNIKRNGFRLIFNSELPFLLIYLQSSSAGPFFPFLLCVQQKIEW